MSISRRPPTVSAIRAAPREEESGRQSVGASCTRWRSTVEFRESACPVSRFG